MPGENEVEFDMDGALEQISSDLNMGNSDGSDRDSDPSPSGAGDQPAGGSAATDPAQPAASGAGQHSTVEPSDGATGPAEVTGDHATPPATWRKEAAELWANLDPRVRAEIHKREADIFRGLDTYKADATFAKSVQSVLAPFKHIIDQYQIDPVKQIGGLVSTHYALATASPERRAEMFKQLAKDYGIDLGTAQPADADNAPYIDPQVKALQEEISGLKSRLERQDQRQLSVVKAETEKEVAAFAADKAHQYFDEVANDIAQLLQSGAAKSLKDAYEKAIWANPVTRQKEIDRIAGERAAKEAAEKAAHAAAARKATSANVRTSAKAGSGTAPLGTMDDTLQQTLAAINARA